MPELTVQGGRFRFAMDDGQHVHVNGAPLPNAEEVAAAIAARVAKTLKDVADRL